MTQETVEPRAASNEPKFVRKSTFRVATYERAAEIKTATQPPPGAVPETDFKIRIKRRSSYGRDIGFDVCSFLSKAYIAAQKAAEQAAQKAPEPVPTSTEPAAEKPKKPKFKKGQKPERKAK